MATDGSPTGNAALGTLASSLGLRPLELKIALEAAHDLMQQNINGSLALHIALARMGYRVDAQALYAKLDAFRNIFPGAFQPFQGPQVVQVRYTPAAMSWQSNLFGEGESSHEQMPPPQSPATGYYYQPATVQQMTSNMQQQYGAGQTPYWG